MNKANPATPVDTVQTMRGETSFLSKIAPFIKRLIIDVIPRIESKKLDLSEFICFVSIMLGMKLHGIKNAISPKNFERQRRMNVGLFKNEKFILFRMFLKKVKRESL